MATCLSPSGFFFEYKSPTKMTTTTMPTASLNDNVIGFSVMDRIGPDRGESQQPLMLIYFSALGSFRERHTLVFASRDGQMNWPRG